MEISPSVLIDNSLSAMTSIPKPPLDFGNGQPSVLYTYWKREINQGFFTRILSLFRLEFLIGTHRDNLLYDRRKTKLSCQVGRVKPKSELNQTKLFSLIQLFKISI